MVPWVFFAERCEGACSTKLSFGRFSESLTRMLARNALRWFWCFGRFVFRFKSSRRNRTAPRFHGGSEDLPKQILGSEQLSYQQIAHTFR